MLGQLRDWRLRVILCNVENRENSILLQFLDGVNKRKTKITTESIEYDPEKKILIYKERLHTVSGDTS